VHLEVWSSQTPEVTNISKHPNKFFPTFVKATEDDELSLETPEIFCEVVDLVRQLHLSNWLILLLRQAMVSQYSHV
jgi:hypothetical protein